MRIVEPEYVDQYPETAKCKVCGNITKHKKEYCPEHIYLIPYVAEVMATVAKLDQEQKGSRKPNLILEDIQQVIINCNGMTTLGNISRTLKLSMRVVEEGVRLLAKKKIVQYEGKQTRKIRKVKLI